jgi:hypothetical protein
MFGSNSSKLRRNLRKRRLEFPLKEQRRAECDVRPDEAGRIVEPFGHTQRDEAISGNRCPYRCSDIAKIVTEAEIILFGLVRALSRRLGNSESTSVTVIRRNGPLRSLIVQ